MVFGRDLNNPNQVGDFSQISSANEEQKKYLATVMDSIIKGDGKITIGENGNLQITADFDGTAGGDAKKYQTKGILESGMLNYELKTAGKAKDIHNTIFTNASDYATKGNLVDGASVASNLNAHIASLDYETVKITALDLDPSFDNDEAKFKYLKITDSETGQITMEHGVEWRQAQELYWNQTTKGLDRIQLGNGDMMWTDGTDKYVYSEAGAGDGLSTWTKNGKKHEWWDDMGWSGDNGTGLKLRDVFSRWYGNLTAEWLNDQPNNIQARLNKERNRNNNNNNRVVDTTPMLDAVSKRIDSNEYGNFGQVIPGSLLMIDKDDDGLIYISLSGLDESVAGTYMNPGQVGPAIDPVS